MSQHARKFKIITAVIFILVTTAALWNTYTRAAVSIQPRGPAIESIAQSSKSTQDQKVFSAQEPALSNQQNSLVLPTENTIGAAIASSTSDKLIVVDIKTQTLSYFEGTTLIGSFKVSTGVPGYDTPAGTYYVQKKRPVVDYKGPGYDFPNTKWNLFFLQGSWGGYYIHGAYWHHNFGHKMSHGCVNVSYANMQPLYNWADVGTKIVIQ